MATNYSIIDADAHVVESARTWDYMDPSEKQYRPIPMEAPEDAGTKLQFWLIDGKVRGFRFPAFSAAELDKRSRQGRRGRIEGVVRFVGEFSCQRASCLGMGFARQDRGRGCVGCNQRGRRRWPRQALSR